MRRAAVLMVLMLVAVTAACAHAAFPGRNGPLAYYFPDPEADLGYVEFAPISGPVTRVFRRWEDEDFPGTISPGGRRMTTVDRWRGRWAIGCSDRSGGPVVTPGS